MDCSRRGVIPASDLALLIGSRRLVSMDWRIWVGMVMSFGTMDENGRGVVFCIMFVIASSDGMVPVLWFCYNGCCGCRQLL